MYRLWSHPDVCRYSGPAEDIRGDDIPLPARRASDSDRIIEFFLEHATADAGFRWALLLGPTGRFAGALGFNHLGETAELAYHLHPSYSGRGLMTRAAKLALDWLGSYSDARSVEAYIDPANDASVRLILRLGFASTGECKDGATRYFRAIDRR